MKLLGRVKLGNEFEDYRRSLWSNQHLYSFLDANAAQEPDRVAIIEARSGYPERRHTTNRELQLFSQRIALGLVAHGIGKGDVVSFQLPNWRQAAALHLACLRIGAISNPLVPIFRDRELEFMLSFAETKLLILPEVFRKFSYRDMWLRLKPKLPLVRDAFFVETSGENSFDEMFMEREWEQEFPVSSLDTLAPSPDDVIQIVYTSGTTGEPKGVMHTSNTLLYGAMAVARHLRLDREVVLMSSTIGHQIGFIWGIMLPILVRGSVVFQDVWDPDVATDLIKEEDVTFSLGSTPFLLDILNSARNKQFDFPCFRKFVCAGAPIPRTLVERGLDEVGVQIFSCWGMTENGAVTLCGPDDPLEKVINSDGKALPGSAVRVVDDTGAVLEPGTEGHLQARTPGMTVGYLKRPELFTCSADGWMDTGDRAVMDEEGFIRISGRSKDIIIRGGENIPVVEIENLLYEHPRIKDVSLVAMPDERLGEKVCAFVSLQEPQSTLTLQDLFDFLSERRVARQYIPEHLELIDDFPRTPSGKIQKVLLRERISAAQA